MAHVMAHFLVASSADSKADSTPDLSNLPAVKSTKLVTAPGKDSTNNVSETAHTTERVPTSLSEAIVTFVKHPTTLLLLTSTAVTSVARFRYAWTLADVLVVPLMAALYFLGEYLVHRFLHGSSKTFAFLTKAHQEHHAQPFHCVSIESPDLVPVATAVIFAFCFALFGRSPVTLTAFLVSLVGGLAFIWIHFLVHTRVPLRSRLWCAIKRAHIVHHLRDEKTGLSITNPAVDWLIGTDSARKDAGIWSE